MNGILSGILRSFGYEEYAGAGSFQTNGAGAPTAAMLRKQLGLPFTVTYGGTGLYTVSFDPAKFKLPVQAWYADANVIGPIASVLDVRVVANELHLPACRLQIQCIDKAGAAVAPPANGAGVSISFSFFGTNNTGR